MNYKEFSGKTVDDALTAATVELGVTSDKINYEVIEKGSAGFLGLGSKNAVIRVKLVDDTAEDDVNNGSNGSNDSVPVHNAEIPETPAYKPAPKTEESPVASSPVEEAVEAQPEQAAHFPRSFEDAAPVDKDEVLRLANEFLTSVFSAMELEVVLSIDYNEDNRMLSIDMSGPEMGIIIGKRGQTLDSLQYLTNLAINRKLDSYVRVKMDTEDYRRRRKATLENLAHHVSYKVKRTKRPVSLEPMNPYERRVIHFALQHDSYVKTESEGDEPYRYVVVSPK